MPFFFAKSILANCSPSLIHNSFTNTIPPMHSSSKIHVIVQRKPFFSGLSIYRTVIPSNSPFSLHLNNVLEGCFSYGLILLCDGLDLSVSGRRRWLWRWRCNLRWTSWESWDSGTSTGWRRYLIAALPAQRDWALDGAKLNVPDTVSSK
jgi:hypothetical protein